MATKKLTKTSRKTKNTKYKRTKQIVKHHYFIVDCNYDKLRDLDTKYLEQYLQNLGLKQDKYIYKYEANKKEFIKTHGISNEDFCKKTKKINFKPNKDKLIADVFFYYIYGMHLNKPFYNYPKFLVNVLNIYYMATVNKDVIYDNVYKINSELADKYFIETFPIHQKEKYNFPDNYILRPVDSFGGDDILYIKNEKELEDAINYYKKNTNYKGVIYGNDVIASKFISNLLLFKGKKLHLRMYYLVSVINGVFNSFLLSVGKIFTAKDKYDLSKPFTKAIHDTHFDSTHDDYFFPEDFTTENIGININSKVVDTIYQKCKHICLGITKILINLNKHKLLYNNQKNGYYFFGIDILLRDNLDPVLIECNNQPGLSCKKHKSIDYLSKEIYGWINDVILEPLFKYNDAYRARKHPTYIKLD